MTRRYKLLAHVGQHVLEVCTLYIYVYFFPLIFFWAKIYIYIYIRYKFLAHVCRNVLEVCNLYIYKCNFFPINIVLGFFGNSYHFWILLTQKNKYIKSSNLQKKNLLNKNLQLSCTHLLFCSLSSGAFSMSDMNSSSGVRYQAT